MDAHLAHSCIWTRNIYCMYEHDYAASTAQKANRVSMASVPDSSASPRASLQSGLDKVLLVLDRRSASGPPGQLAFQSPFPYREPCAWSLLCTSPGERRHSMLSSHPSSSVIVPRIGDSCSVQLQTRLLPLVCSTLPILTASLLSAKFSAWNEETAVFDFTVRLLGLFLATSHNVNAGKLLLL